MHGFVMYAACKSPLDQLHFDASRKMQADWVCNTYSTCDRGCFLLSCHRSTITNGAGLALIMEGPLGLSISSATCPSTGCAFLSVGTALGHCQHHLSRPIRALAQSWRATCVTSWAPCITTMPEHGVCRHESLYGMQCVLALFCISPASYSQLDCGPGPAGGWQGVRLLESGVSLASPYGGHVFVVLHSHAPFVP